MQHRVEVSEVKVVPFETCWMQLWATTFTLVSVSRQVSAQTMGDHGNLMAIKAIIGRILREYIFSLATDGRLSGGHGLVSRPVHHSHHDCHMSEMADKFKSHCSWLHDCKTSISAQVLFSC